MVFFGPGGTLRTDAGVQSHEFSALLAAVDPCIRFHPIPHARLRVNTGLLEGVGGLDEFRRGVELWPVWTKVLLW